MQLAYAIVADAAQVTSDGKVSMLGGGFDTIRVPSLPFIHPTLALVALLDVAKDESNRDHQLRIEFIGPLGSRPNPPAMSTFRPQPNPAGSDRPIRFQFVANLQGVLFEQFGKHVIRLVVDGEELGIVPLYIEKV
jgi:hypothetical protein